MKIREAFLTSAVSVDLGKEGGGGADAPWQPRWSFPLGDWPWVKWKKLCREERSLCRVTDRLSSPTQPSLSILPWPGAPVSCYRDFQVELQRTGTLFLLTQQTTGLPFIPHLKRHRMRSPSMGPPQCLLGF